MVLETSPIPSTLYRPPAAAALPPDHDPLLSTPAFRQDLLSQAPSCIASGSTVSGPPALHHQGPPSQAPGITAGSLYKWSSLETFGMPVPYAEDSTRWLYCSARSPDIEVS